MTLSAPVQICRYGAT